MSQQKHRGITATIFIAATLVCCNSVAQPASTASDGASSSPSLGLLSPAASAASPQAASNAQSGASTAAIVESSAKATISPDLEKTLSDLAKALTRFVENKSEPEKLTATLLELLEKLGALIGTLIAGYAAYKASTSVPWFKENKEFVATVVVAASIVVLFYLLSGIVTPVLYVLTAILILLIALTVATAHLLSFIDTRYPDVRESILSSFSESTKEKPLRKLARDNARNLYDFLTNIAFIQSIAGEPEFTLMGSVAEGFEESIFRFTPSERLASSWQIVDDRLLVPVGMTLTVRTADGIEAVVVNIQFGFVVVRIDGKLEVRKFSQAGFQILGSSLVVHQMNKLQATLEQQQSFANNIRIFNDQSK